MDDVATAQLELLYKLGVLEREPVEEQDDEDYDVHPLLRLQPAPLRQTPRQRKSPSIAAAKPSPPPCKATELCFLRWKLFVRDQKDQTVVKKLHLVGAKRQTFRKWRTAVRLARMRRQHQRTLQVWRLCRRIRYWQHWTQRMQRIASLLSHPEHRVMNRLRKQRVWIRWTLFVGRQSFHRTLVQKRRAAWRKRLLGDVWMELEIHALRSRQSRRSLAKVMHAMRLRRDIRLMKQQTLLSQRRHLQQKHKTRVLRAWQQVIQVKLQDRVTQRHVHRLITRRRFFNVWHETFYYRRLIARLRSQVVERSLRRHFQAWRVTVRAIAVGVGVKTAVCIQMRAQSFQMWKQHVGFSLHCQTIEHQLKRRRQQNAVRRFRRWFISQKRQRIRMIGFAQKRVSRMAKHVWCHGWLVYHEQQHQKRTREHSMTQMVLRRSYRTWTKYCLHVIQRKQIQVKSDHMTLIWCFKAHFKPWKAYWEMRKHIKRQHTEADSYYRSRLIQLVLGKLWQLVDQRNLESQQISTLRRKSRLRLAGRCFGTWKRWVSSRQHLEDLRSSFQTGHRYERSIWNPLRRRWDCWLTLVEMARLSHRSDRFRSGQLIERSFTRWTTHYRLAARIRRQRHSLQIKTLRGLYRIWRCSIAAWKRKREMMALACCSHRRSRLSKVMKAWSKCCALYLKRIRMQFECLQKHSNTQVYSSSFRIWNAQSRRRTLARQWEDQRQSTLLAICFAKWRYRSVQSIKLQRKLVYFSHAIGKYPVTSLVCRVWISWKSFTVRRQKLAFMLHHQAEKRSRICLLLWKRYHFFCCVFRQWHLTAVSITGANKHLGRRIRLMRELLQRRRKASAYAKWKLHYRRRQLQQEVWIHMKHCVATEIVTVNSVRERVLKRRLHICFQKWRASLHVNTKSATRHYASRILRKILHCWWTVMVHSKQDRVTSRAKQSSNKTDTFYHPQQQRYAHQARAAAKPPKRRRPPSEAPQTDDSTTRVQEMKHLRRMMDPTANTGYLQSHQKVGCEFENGNGFQIRDRLDSSISMENTLTKQKPSSRQVVVNVQPHVSPRRRLHSQCHAQLENTMMKDHTNQFSRTRLPLQDTQLGSMEARSDVSGGMGRMKTHQRNAASSDLERLRSSTQRVALIPNVLPLFDADSNQESTQLTQVALPLPVVEVTKCHGHQESAPFDALPPPPPPPSPPPVRVASHSGDSVGVELSLENLAQMDVYTTTMPSQAASVTHNSKDPQVTAATTSECSLQRHKDNGKSTRSHKCLRPKNRNGIPVSEQGLNVSLAAILEIPASQKPELTKNNQEKPISSQGTSDRELVMAITGHYSQSLHEISRDASDNDRQQLLVRLQKTCFCMLRDLSLFRNDFYVTELEDVIGRTAAVDTIVAVLGSADKAEMDKVILQRSVQEFLDDAIENHPLYARFCSKLHKKEREWPLPSDLAVNSLRWLVQVHLRPRLTICNGQYVWTKHEMPNEMQLALEKLWLCVKKYKHVLLRFFSWKDESQPVIHSVDYNHRMRKVEFLGLMKYAHAFPQLLHRREIENAVEMSCCSRPIKAELNFAEFIEALVRCSSCLHWGEPKVMAKESDKEVETGIVIKFLMLIFAMEGRGSVLSKRNDDLQIVVRYLEQQHDRGKAEKMQRFHGLLAQQKSQLRTRSTKSIWRSLNRHGHQQDDISLVSPEDERSVDEYAPAHELREAHYSWTDQQAFEWTHSRMPAKPFDLVQYASWSPIPNSYPNESIDVTSGYEDLQDIADQSIQIDYQSAILLSSNRRKTECKADEEGKALSEPDSFHDTSSELRKNVEDNIALVGCTDEDAVSIKRWDFEPQGKSEFLADILSNIDDVELLLQQSRSLERNSEPDKFTPGTVDGCICDEGLLT